MSKLLSLLKMSALSLVLAAVAGPAMASELPISVPEPGTLGLLTVGIGGAYLASKYLRRK